MHRLHTPRPPGKEVRITESVWLLGLLPGGLIAGYALVQLVPRIPLWGWVVIASAVYAIQRAL